MSTMRIVAPTALAVSLDEAKLELRVDGADLDASITRKIKEITEYAEHIMGRSVMRQTWRNACPAFTSKIQLLNVPVLQVVSVTYLDTSSARQTLAPTAYELQEDELDTYLVLRQAIANLANHPSAIQVNYEAGYGDTPSAVPETIRGFIIAKLIEQMDPSYKQSDNSIGRSYVDSLLDRYRIWA